MDLQNIDKETLKSAIREILMEDVDFLREILLDRQDETPEKSPQEQTTIETLIDNNFDKYDAVFKALA